MSALPWFKASTDQVVARMETRRWNTCPPDDVCVIEVIAVVASDQIQKWGIKRWARQWVCSTSKVYRLLRDTLTWMDTHGGTEWWGPDDERTGADGIDTALIPFRYTYLKTFPALAEPADTAPIRDQYGTRTHRARSSQSAEVRVQNNNSPTPEAPGIPKETSHELEGPQEVEEALAHPGAGVVLDMPAPDPGPPGAGLLGAELRSGAPLRAEVPGPAEPPPEPAEPDAEAGPGEAGDPSVHGAGGDSVLSLPDLLEHDAKTLQVLITGLSLSGRLPSLEVLLGMTTIDLQALTGMGPKRVANVKAALDARGLSLNDPVPPEQDPRVNHVIESWATAHRHYFKAPDGKPARIIWDFSASRDNRGITDRHRAQRIADIAQGHGDDAKPWAEALQLVRGAFTAYLGDLGAPANWPNRPTLTDFAMPRMLAGRFTGAAPRAPSRGAVHGRSLGASPVDDMDFSATQHKEQQWTTR